VHDVQFDEGTDFEQQSQCTVVSLGRATDLVRPVALRREARALRVQFVWDWLLGAPERAHGRAIRLRRGDWCQILANGRYGRGYPWSYTNVVINVAFDAQSLSVFETSDPAERDDHRADLW